jgi:hypothetical protein
MTKSINNATMLLPVVKKAVKALYGPSMEDIRILKADQFPLFHDPKQGWLVHTEFNDGRYEYSVQLEVQMADGRITRSLELNRKPRQGNA